jgi:hypothetical protein
MEKYSMLATKFILSALLAIAAAPAFAAPADEPPPANRQRSPEATQPHEGPGGSTIWVDPTEWTWVKSDSANTLVLVYKTGMAQVRLVADDKPVEQEKLLDGLLERLKKVDPEPKLLFQETRRINGVDMLCVQVKVSDGKRDVVYYGVAHGNENGSIELFTVTWEGLLGGYYEDLTQAIEGLELAGKAGTQP